MLYFPDSAILLNGSQPPCVFGKQLIETAYGNQTPNGSKRRLTNAVLIGIGCWYSDVHQRGEAGWL